MFKYQYTHVCVYVDTHMYKLGLFIFFTYFALKLLVFYSYAHRFTLKKKKPGQKQSKHLSADK